MAARLMRVLVVLGYYTVFVLIIKCYSHFLEDFYLKRTHFLEDFCLNQTHFLEDFCSKRAHFLEDFEKWELIFTPGTASEALGNAGNPCWAE